jgi:hypothetical protein
MYFSDSIVSVANAMELGLMPAEASWWWEEGEGEGKRKERGE